MSQAPQQQSQTSDAHEARVLAGVLLANQGFTLAEAARITGAPKETIRRRRNGVPARDSLAQHGEQRLTDAEEAVIVDYILEMEKSGFPLRQGDVEQSAWTLIKARSLAGLGGPEPPHFGNKWFSRFIQRHSDRLSFRTKETLSSQRTKGLSKANADHFFYMLEGLMREYNLTPENIYSMDETGIQLGVATKKFKYAGSSQPRKDVVTAKQDGSQELVTIIESICADGSTLPHVYIFKGKTYDATLSLDGQQQALYTASETGWTNAIIAHRWFQKVFEPYSQAKANGAWRLLIMDGHVSHFTLDMLKLAREKKVHILSLPAHSTHGLAPLDRTCFAPLKVAWAEQQRLEYFMTNTVRRDDFVRLYESARKVALTPANITSGYAATGIWPLKGTSVIRESMFAQTMLTDPELAEAEQDAWLTSNIAERLCDMVPSLRSQRARETVKEASRRIREADAAKLLFNHETERLRKHAAGLKAKPRAFRIAEEGFGQAKLWTKEESIAQMEEARKMKEAEEQRLEEGRKERERKKEEKEKEQAEKKARTETRKAAQLAKKIAAEREKRERQELAKKRKAEQAALAANKPAKRSRKNAPKNGGDATAAPENGATDTPTSSVLQPTQLTNH